MLNPPRERPIAWSSPAFFGARAVLMGAHDGTVDHRVFVIGIHGQVAEKPFPNARLGPSAEATMHVLPIPEALRQVTPRNTSTIAIEHCLDEPAIIRRSRPHIAIAPGQQVSDTFPLIVAKTIAPHRSAPTTLTSYESNFPPRRNPLIDDTPSHFHGFVSFPASTIHAPVVGLTPAGGRASRRSGGAAGRRRCSGRPSRGSCAR